MGALEFRRFLGSRLIQHKHMDDRILECRGWPVLVAGLDLRLGRLLDCWRLRCCDRAHWRYLSHRFPSCQSRLFRGLGWALASIEQICNGLYLVWSSIVDWYDEPPGYVNCFQQLTPLQVASVLRL